MALQGRNPNEALPYIVERERDNMVDPTVFWIKPKNIKATNETLAGYSNAGDTTRVSNRKTNPGKLTEADVNDFLNFCSKVNTFIFSSAYTELHEKGAIPEISDKPTLRLVALELDPRVFNEVQNATADWELLEAGMRAYEAFQKTKAS